MDKSIPLLKPVQRCMLLFCLLLPLLCRAEQYVELTAEIDFGNWDWWFFCDEQNVHPGMDKMPSIFHTNHVYQCVIGTNAWLMEQQSDTSTRAYWFTGTNLIEQTLTSNLAPHTDVSASLDGNPGRTGGVADLMTFDTVGRICWLALCSGPALKREGRHIFPPSDFWKESRLGFSDSFVDKTTVFPDDLGLPKSLTLLSTNDQTVLQYQAHLTTNFLGWTFPREFYLVQYWPTGSNEWKVYLTAKGRITSIGTGTKPEIPKEVSKPNRIEK